jgi:hypothetical protein
VTCIAGESSMVFGVVIAFHFSLTKSEMIMNILFSLFLKLMILQSPFH